MNKLADTFLLNKQLPFRFILYFSFFQNYPIIKIYFFFQYLISVLHFQTLIKISCNNHVALLMIL